MRQRKLLLVVNSAAFFISHRLPIAMEGQKRGYDVHVATPAGERSAEIEAAGLRWHPIRLRRSNMNVAKELRTVVDLIKLYRELRPDLVHHVTSKPVLFGTIAARLTHVPAVVNAITGLGHVFISDRLFYRVLRAAIGMAYRLVLRHPHMRVIFQNSDDRELFVQSGWVREGEDVVIAGSGVDPQEFRPREAGGDQIPLVMFASRMLRTKGLPEFVDAVRILKREGVPARYVLVGDPDPSNPASVGEEVLRGWASEIGLEYWGYRADMPAVLRGADIVCLPSHREGIPKVLIEAAACAIPIVTTDTPGCNDIVHDGINGILIPIGDVARLAAALRTLIEDPPLRLRMGAAGRDRVIREFSLRSVIEQTFRLYAELGV